MRVYYEVCDGFLTEDIEHSVRRFLSGSVEGYNPSFAPTPPMMAQELRRWRDEARKYDSFDRAARLQLESRDKADAFDAEKTADSRARVKALIDGVVGKRRYTAGDDPVARDD